MTVSKTNQALREEVERRNLAVHIGSDLNYEVQYLISRLFEGTPPIKYSRVYVNQKMRATI